MKLGRWLIEASGEVEGSSVGGWIELLWECLNAATRGGVRGVRREGLRPEGI